MDGARGLYPVALDVAGRECLVVGAGPVAARKAAGLLAAGALVTVVAPDVGDDMERLRAAPPTAGGGRLTVERRPYAPGDAGSFRLVVTATGIDTVDAAVSADAESARVWVNSADNPAHCSFLLPSVHRDGPVSIAVSTSGASPALARWLRRRVANAAGTDLGTLAELLEAARRQVREDGRSTEEIDWTALLDGPLPDLVRAGDLAAARAVLAAAIRGRPPG
jgi:siroheme synthase-like protein